MKFTCDQCQAQYMIADEKVGPKGVKVRCKKCSNIITVKRDDSSAADNSGAAAETKAPEAAATAPAAGGGSFDDMFGNAPAEDESYERQPTKVFTSQDLQKVREEQMRAQGGAAPVASPEPAAASVGGMTEQPEWYVAINDEQVGPITMSDLETRWDAGQVQPDSLAWRNGLADWQPITAISELSRLISRPQASAPRAATTPSYGSEPQAAPTQTEKPAEKPAVTWRPSGASALADLVKDAVVEQKKPEVAPAPTFGTGEPAAVADPFASLPSFSPGNQGSPQTMWQMPSQMAPRPQESGGNKTVIILLSVVIVAILGVGGLFAAGVIGRPPPPPPQPSLAVAIPPPQPTAPVAVPQPSAPAQASAPVAASAPAPAPSAPVAVAPPPTQSAPTGKKGKKGQPGAVAAADPTPPPPQQNTPPKKKNDDLGSLFGDGGSKPEPAKSNLPQSLDKGQVFGVVKANFPAVRACVDKYVASGGGKALPAQLSLKWVIVPTGGTTSQEMASPELKGTSVEPCVVGVIKSFKFPEFQTGTIPVTFPFRLSQ